jgi:hypothetical protein
MTAVSRRTVLRTAGIAAGSAALSLPALPAIGAMPDPLIALGEAERAAYQKYDAAAIARDRAEGAFRDRHGKFPKGRAATGMDRSLYVAEDDAQEAWDRSIQAIVDTPASSFIGLAVKLRQVVHNGENDGDVFASAIADAERMIRGVS